jgi:hypothetical protein
MLSAEDTEATNEYINDGEFVQPLTITEIQALKQAGVHANASLYMPVIEPSYESYVVLSGYHKKTDRATFELFPQNGV